MNNLQEENLAPPLVKSESVLDKLKELREKISPEKQYAVSFALTYIYLIILVAPEQLPIEAQPVVQLLNELLNQIPLGTLTIKLTILATFLGSIDGARRIAFESLPFYKAYLQVFLLNKD